MARRCLRGNGSCATPETRTDAVLLVLDSSAALRAAMSADAQRTLAPHDLIAPPLLWSEVFSAVHEALWRRDLSRAAAADALASFSALGVRRRAPARLHREAYTMASEWGWAKTYDAEFVALARLESATVLTTDARLRRGADRTGLVIDPRELPGS
jgi:predicted nucleic acid-binding protein